MKYLLIALMTMTWVFADVCEDYSACNYGDEVACEYPSEGFNCAGQPELFGFESSQFQGFYFPNEVTIDGTPISSDDWVAAFKGDVCVGARLWDTALCGGICDVPAQGDDGSELSDGYMLIGDTPTFKIYDASADTYYDADVVGNFEVDGEEMDGGWANLSFIMLDGLQSSELTEIAGCMDEGACNYDAIANSSDGNCEYATENYNCAGDCTAEIDDCGICNGDGIPEGD